MMVVCGVRQDGRIGEMQTMRGLMMDFPLTVPTILERAGNVFGNVEIVSRRPDRSLARSTWKDLYRRSRRLANALTGLGLRRGDRVATLHWNHTAHMEAYFGVPAAGGVLHTLNLRLHPDELSVHRQSCGRPFSDCGRCAAAHLRKVRRPREIRPRDRRAVRWRRDPAGLRRIRGIAG